MKIFECFFFRSMNEEEKEEEELRERREEEFEVLKSIFSNDLRDMR